eukprot:gene4145-8241_t
MPPTMKARICIHALLIWFTLFVRINAGSDSFSLGIRDSIMIAHSFKGEEFGPAQNLHGATYTVDVDFTSNALQDKVNWVVDIGEASQMLSEVLQQYNFKHLNELFPDENTTTEFMCRVIHRDLESKLKHKCFQGNMSVKLWESHKAWASYSKALQNLSQQFCPAFFLSLSHMQQYHNAGTRISMGTHMGCTVVEIRPPSGSCILQ